MLYVHQDLTTLSGGVILNLDNSERELFVTTAEVRGRRLTVQDEFSDEEERSCC